MRKETIFILFVLVAILLAGCGQQATQRQLPLPNSPLQLKPLRRRKLP